MPDFSKKRREKKEAIEKERDIAAEKLVVPKKVIELVKKNEKKANKIISDLRAKKIFRLQHKEQDSEKQKADNIKEIKKQFDKIKKLDLKKQDSSEEGYTKKVTDVINLYNKYVNAGDQQNISNILSGNNTTLTFGEKKKLDGYISEIEKLINSKTPSTSKHLSPIKSDDFGSIKKEVYGKLTAIGKELYTIYRYYESCIDTKNTDKIQKAYQKIEKYLNSHQTEDLNKIVTVDEGILLLKAKTLELPINDKLYFINKDTYKENFEIVLNLASALYLHYYDKKEKLKETLLEINKKAYNEGKEDDKKIDDYKQLGKTIADAYKKCKKIVTAYTATSDQLESTIKEIDTLIKNKATPSILYSYLECKKLYNKFEHMKKKNELSLKQLQLNLETLRRQKLKAFYGQYVEGNTTKKYDPSLQLENISKTMKEFLQKVKEFTSKCFEGNYEEIEKSCNELTGYFKEFSDTVKNQIRIASTPGAIGSKTEDIQEIFEKMKTKIEDLLDKLNKHVDTSYDFEEKIDAIAVLSTPAEKVKRLKEIIKEINEALNIESIKNLTKLAI